MHSEPIRGDRIPDTSLGSGDTELNIAGDTGIFSPLPLVSSELLVGVHFHHAQLFVLSGERFLHSIVNMFAHGIHDPEYRKLRDSHITELDGMGKEIRELMSTGDQLLNLISEQIKLKQLDKISLSVTEGLYPLLRALSSFAERAYALNMRVSREWLETPVEDKSPVTLIHFSPDHEFASQDEDHSLDPETETVSVDRRATLADHLADAYLDIKETLAQFDFSVNPCLTSIDANQFLLDLSHRFSCEISFNATPCSVEMDRSHLELACSIALRELFDTALRIRTTTTAQGFAENDFFSYSEDEIEQSAAFAQVLEAFFGKIRCNVSIVDSDCLNFDIPAPSCLTKEWKEELPSLRNSLGTVEQLLKPYHGHLDVSFIPDDECIRVSLTLPMRTNTAARTGDDCYAEYYAHQQNPYSISDAMMVITFDRAFINHRNDLAYYQVETSGAALLSPEARSHMRQVLDRADLYMRSIPSLKSIELRASGTTSHIEKAFNEGSFEIVLHGERETSFRAYNYVHDRFSWEKKVDDADPDNTEYLSRKERVSFNATLFFDDQIRRDLIELSKIGKLSQIPCEHQQEQRFGETPTLTDDLARSMISDLARAVKSVRAQGHDGELRIEVMEVMAFRIAQVGSFDNIFALNVFNDKNEKLAHGGFSREKKYWSIVHYDAAMIEELLNRVQDAIASLPADKINFRSLDKALQERHVQLEENLLMSIVKSATAAPSDDEYFGRPSVPRLVRAQGESINMRIQLEGDTITVVDVGQELPMQGSFGLIFDINLQNPEEVANYFVARNLYEKNYPFFQANEVFLQRYDEEDRSPRDEEELI